MSYSGYALIDSVTGKVSTTFIPTSTEFEMIFKSVQIGYDGFTGALKLYSEQGAVDAIATLKPHASMMGDQTYYFPNGVPVATYLMTMTNAGVMGFDSSVYIDNTNIQTINGVKTFGSFPITPSANPTTAYQVANKAYVDTLAGGLKPHPSVRAVTTTALPACTYTGTPTFTLVADATGVIPAQDGVTLVNGNRLLVKDQADQKQNGIYVVTNIGVNGPAGLEFTLTRADDFNSDSEVTAGNFTYVTEGSTRAGYQYAQTTPSATLDSSNLVFGILYAPLAETLNSVTSAGSSTTNAITVGGITTTKQVIESSIKNLVFSDSPYTVLSTDRHIYCKTAAGAITINLPVATGTGRIISIGKRDNAQGVITIVADTTGTPDLINGQATLVLSDIYDDATIQDCANNEWAIK